MIIPSGCSVKSEKIMGQRTLCNDIDGRMPGLMAYINTSTDSPPCTSYSSKRTHQWTTTGCVMQCKKVRPRAAPEPRSRQGEVCGTTYTVGGGYKILPGDKVNATLLSKIKCSLFRVLSFVNVFSRSLSCLITCLTWMA